MSNSQDLTSSSSDYVEYCNYKAVLDAEIELFVQEQLSGTRAAEECKQQVEAKVKYYSQSDVEIDFIDYQLLSEMQQEVRQHAYYADMDSLLALLDSVMNTSA